MHNKYKRRKVEIYVCIFQLKELNHHQQQHEEIQHFKAISTLLVCEILHIEKGVVLEHTHAYLNLSMMINILHPCFLNCVPQEPYGY